MYDPAIELLGIYLHELKTYIYKKKNSAGGYSTFIYICQSLDVSKVYFSRWMDKKTMTNQEKLLMLGWIKLGFLSGFLVKNSPAVQEIKENHIQSVDRADPLKEEMTTHSSNLV